MRQLDSFSHSLPLIPNNPSQSQYMFFGIWPDEEPQCLSMCYCHSFALGTRQMGYKLNKLNVIELHCTSRSNCRHCSLHDIEVYLIGLMSIVLCMNVLVYMLQNIK
jgi:hypothetical protein